MNLKGLGGSGRSQVEGIEKKTEVSARIVISQSIIASGTTSVQQVARCISVLSPCTCGSWLNLCVNFLFPTSELQIPTHCNPLDLNAQIWRETTLYILHYFQLPASALPLVPQEQFPHEHLLWTLTIHVLRSKQSVTFHNHTNDFIVRLQIYLALW